jgi:hypothetical protein
LIGSDVRITTADGDSRDASLAWNGTEYGIIWADNRDGSWKIFFNRISAEGELIGSNVRITNTSGGSRDTSFVWTGTEYGVAWEDSRDGNEEIYFNRISASGGLIGSDVRISNASGGSRDASLIWTGTEYGIAWEDFRDGNWEIYFSRISAEGDLIGSHLRVTNAYGESRNASLVWTGTGYGISWEDFRGENWNIYFARMSCLD